MRRDKYLKGEKTDFELLRKREEEYKKALEKLVKDNKIMISPHYDTMDLMGLV
jgi:hypothetical protein